MGPAGQKRTGIPISLVKETRWLDILAASLLIEHDSFSGRENIPDRYVESQLLLQKEQRRWIWG